MKVQYSARTDVGLTRSHNEDCYGYGSEEQAKGAGYLLVVCDGMGGHAAGEVASCLAVDTILDRYYHSADPDRSSALEESFILANSAIYAQGRGAMGTTGVAALLFEDSLYVANVGDSRAYLLRDGALRQLTQDHSFVAEQVAAGLLTPEQARHSVHRNVITRALGYQPEVAVDMTRWPLRNGDLILLTSDGLHGLVEDAEIERMAAQHALDELVSQLIDMANARGGSDNITVAVIRVEELEYVLADTQPQKQSANASGYEDTSIHEATTRRLPADIAPPPTLRASGTPSQQPQPPPAPATRELPLRLWGALLTGATLLTLLSFALWFSIDPRFNPVETPTSTRNPSIETRTTLTPPSPRPTRVAPTASSIPPSSTPNPTPLR